MTDDEARRVIGEMIERQIGEACRQIADAMDRELMEMLPAYERDVDLPGTYNYHMSLARILAIGKDEPPDDTALDDPQWEAKVHAFLHDVHAHQRDYGNDT